MNALVLFLLKAAAVIGPLWFLARRKRIYPHRPMVFLATAPALMSVALIGLPELWPLVLAVDALALTAALADLLTVPRAASISVERSTGRTASLKKKHQVKLVVSNLGRRACFVRVRDSVDPLLQPEPEEFRLLLEPRSRAEVHYVLTPSRRGAYQIDQVHCAARSRFGLWQRYLDYPVETTLHVYPDLVQLSQYAVLARQNRTSLMGMRNSRRVGGDNDFERLRDYTLDDNYKHIDWRSTARRGKLTVKDFQANQSQRLIFLIDCGRMMTNQASGLSLLDHGLNAMLMLSYVALSRGDQVGLLTFSDDIHGFIPPAGGMRQMNRLLHESFNRFPGRVESRYDRAFLYLGAHCRKRSMVVLVTNVVDEVNGSQVERYLTSFVGRHLPLGVLLRDRRLFEFAEHADPQGDHLFRAAAAANILHWRDQVLADLESKGALTIDAYPEDLTAPLVNRYLDVKARHLL